MVSSNTDRNETAFTVSVDVLEGTTSGASAYDRAKTARRLAQPEAVATDFSRPGHLFPLIARDGGVLERQGHTEASVDLCLLAGLEPVAVIGELMRSDGTMMRLRECREFAAQHNLKLINVEQIIRYRQGSPTCAQLSGLAQAQRPKPTALAVDHVTLVEVS
jgi:3,4-dihydroxy 2-butanone 4-phosphate synthase/GTP cyclohydrolase II